MTRKNKKLTEFVEGNCQQPTESSSTTQDLEDENGDSKNDIDDVKIDSDSSIVCDYYHEMERKYRDQLNRLGITPPKCGHCIAYLCNETSAGTARTYNSALRLFVERLHQQEICIDEVEYIDVRNYFEFRSKQGRSKSTINSDKAAIEGVISRFEAEKKDFPVVSWKISQNIDANNYGGDTVFERDPLEDEEIEKLLTASDNFRNQLMMLTTIETGPRAEATCLIEVSDVDLEKKEVELRNTKTEGTYIMPLTDNLATLLEHWIRNVRSSYLPNENNPYLFPSREGGRISKSRYRDIVKTVAKEAGIQEEIAKIPISDRQKRKFNIDKDYRNKNRVDVHVLRHTFSRLLKDDDVSKNARRYALDHAPDVTDGYGIDVEACRKELRNKFNGVDISSL